MHKITYEYKGVKISIEAKGVVDDTDVAKAILKAQEYLPKVFSEKNYRKILGDLDILPYVLTPLDVKNILKISQNTAYDLIKDAINTGAFTAKKFDTVYRISKPSFLKWLLGYESSDLSDNSFRVFNCDEIQKILLISQKTAYTIINQALINNWFEVKKIGRIYRIPAVPFLEWIDSIDSIEKRFE